jgi:hypothetical protein
LGRKQAPVTSAWLGEDGRLAEAPLLPLTQRYEAEDSHLSNLAA